MELEFPGITDRAKEEGAEIFFGDEMGLQKCVAAATREAEAAPP